MTVAERQSARAVAPKALALLLARLLLAHLLLLTCTLAHLLMFVMPGLCPQGHR